MNKVVLGSVCSGHPHWSYKAYVASNQGFSGGLPRLRYARLGLFSQHGISCPYALSCPCNLVSVHADCLAGSTQPGMPGMTLALQHGISEPMAPQPGTRMV